MQPFAATGFSSSAPLVISCSLFPIIFLCLGGVLLPLKLSFCLKTYWLVYPFNLSYLLRLPIDLSILSIFLTFEVTYWLVYPFNLSYLWGYLLTCLSFNLSYLLGLPIELFYFLPFDDAKVRLFAHTTMKDYKFFLSFCIVFDINQVFVFAHRLFFLCCPHFHFHEVGEFFKLWDGELLGAFGHQWVLEEGVGRWFVAKELS